MPSKPHRRSFIAATPAFAQGRDTPRAFLELCLEQIDAREKDVLAFVETAIPAARSAADASTAALAAAANASYAANAANAASYAAKQKAAEDFNKMVEDAFSAQED